MVQQNYIHRLALGRSAFEAPSTRIENAPTQSQPPEEDAVDEQYAQHYDDRGHPVNSESRAASRRLRRAQNDVLSTIGITLPTGVPRSGTKSVEATAATKRQNDLEDLEGWSALGLSLMFEALMSASTTAIHNQRVRLQTFARYAGIPVTHAILSESGRQSVISYFFAGESEFWASHAVDLVSRLLIMTVPAGFEQLWIRCLGEERFATRRLDTVEKLEQLLNFGTNVALCPFYAIVSLQRLQLIPATPLFIWPWQYSLKMAYLSLLPPVPATWSVATTIQFCGAVPLSPLGLSILTEFAISKCRHILTGYSRAGLIRPDNPERKAIMAAQAHPDDKWPINDYPLLQSSLKEELAKDLRWIGKTTTFYWFRLKNFFAPTPVRRHRQQMLTTFLEPSRSDPQHEEITRLFQEVREMGENLSTETPEESERRLDQIEQHLARLNELTSDGPESQNVQERLGRANELVHTVRDELQNLTAESEHTSGPARHNSLQEESASQAVTDDDEETQDVDEDGQTRGPLSSHPPANSTPPSLDSSPGSSPPLAPTNVQVRTRSGSTSTLHMDVEINQAAIDGSTYTTSFSASPRSAAVETAISQIVSEDDASTLPHHRVTELSLLPADLLSQSILRVAIQALILPLQSYQSRVIARTFLMSTDPGAVSEVFHPTSWFGFGLRRGGVGNAIGYVSKLGFCLGAEVLLSVGSWLMISQAATLMGRKWFLWGKF